MASGMGASAVTGANVADPLSDDDHDVYSDSTAPTVGVEEDTKSVFPHDRIRFNLNSAAFGKQPGNVLANSNLLPVNGIPVSASFFAESEKAALLPQGRAIV
jgi:hypothetical protein